MLRRLLLLLLFLFWNTICTHRIINTQYNITLLRKRVTFVRLQQIRKFGPYDTKVSKSESKVNIITARRVLLSAKIAQVFPLSKSGHHHSTSGNRTPGTGSGRLVKTIFWVGGRASRSVSGVRPSLFRPTVCRQLVHDTHRRRLLLRWNNEPAGGGRLTVHKSVVCWL